MAAVAAPSSSLLSALLAVQAAAPSLSRDKTATVTSPKGSYTYRYSSLDSVMDVVGPLLIEHRLVWSAKPSHDGQGRPTLRYALMHAETGEAETGEMLLLAPKEDPQGQGSAITYARRYALCAVLNLVADDDDDGQQASVSSAPRSQEAPAPSNTVDLRNEAKGLSDQGIRVALTTAGLSPGEKPWGQLARIPLSKATNLRTALDAAHKAEGR